MFFTWLPMFLYLAQAKHALPEPEEEIPVEPFQYFQPPPEIDPDEAMDASAVHETAGLLRMFRAGMTPARLCRVFNYSKESLMHWMNLGLDDEHEAHRLGVSVYDDKIISCGCGRAMVNVQGSQKFYCEFDGLQVIANPSYPGE